MTRRAEQAQRRADFHAAQGVLLITREPPPAPPTVQGQPLAVPSNPAEGVEILLAVWDDGSVTALNGHVDLGTGIRTALSQLVADELDVDMADVHMVLGSTTLAPNQGATIASASLQIHSAPLRAAAAQARAWLLARAAQQLNVLPSALQMQGGVVTVQAEPTRQCRLGELLTGQHVALTLALATPLKAASEHRVIGQSVDRVDIPAKVTGGQVYVHDMRVPGMLHGRVVRPPYAGADHGDFIGNTLESVDESSIAHIPGVRAVVVIRDFVGVVAEREEQAEQAMRELRVQWKDWPGLPPLGDLQQALRNNPSTQRRLVDEGDVDGALAQAAQRLSRTYVWPYQLHASIGPSCALAQWHGDAVPGEPNLTVWAGTQNPHVLRADLAKLLGLNEIVVDVLRMEAAGCYGRNGADDVAADAALLARAVGAPVRVQLTREQEHAWEPKGAAQLMDVRGGLNADGTVAAYDFETSYPSNGAPTLALLLTRTVEPFAQAYEMGDRTARPPYAFENLRVSVNDMAPILRASWLRGVSALPNSFAHESYIDELAAAAGVDPVEFRLQYLQDPRASELLAVTAERAGWQVRTAPRQHTVEGTGGDVLRGQGVAYARYVHSKWPGFGAAWAAWVADVEVNRRTGEVHVSRVVVGHDAGMMINPAGVQQQIHGNVLQTTSRALKEELQIEPRKNTVATQEWGSYPILNFRDVPVIEVVTLPRQNEAPLGAGESSSVPGTAAIANAIFDATGVRFREPPFTPERVRAALQSQAISPEVTPSEKTTQPPTPLMPEGVRWPLSLPRWSRVGALLAGLIGTTMALLGGRAVIAPLHYSPSALYTAETIERGRQLAAVGNCVVCHTAPGGIANAGGRAMRTPFGTIYTTNLTPDPAHGIGQWSFSAFQRAMREGISRDGRHLYPAFPFTSFAKMNDDDLVALYGYLMAQPAVASAPPKTALAFPFSQRAFMASWNGLFHDPQPFVPTPGQSVEWNRGAYLVDGVGHCGACHTPRNALGAERSGAAYLSGAMVDGWEAPALTALSRAPVPWSADEFYHYLRHGHTEHHGMAAGTMAPVVQQLAQVPDADIRAMATYLASFNQPATDTAIAAQAKLLVQEAAEQRSKLVGSTGQRMFDGACSACHHEGDGPKLLGVNRPLALNTNLHSTQPDNLLRVILDGVQDVPGPDVGFMPGFRHALNDAQIADLARYMRQRYAPAQPAWSDLESAVARVRSTLSAH
jgi:nicotinate dehydrogenase subunit B